MISPLRHDESESNGLEIVPAVLVQRSRSDSLRGMAGGEAAHAGDGDLHPELDAILLVPL